MWKKIKDFWARLKPTALWAAGYMFLAYGLFRWLFRFDIFEWDSWARLSATYLHGLWGGAFGILLVTVPALFIATTVTVWNNKKGLIDWPKKEKKDDKKDDKTNKEEYKKKDEVPLPDNLPEELRAPYLKMRAGSLVRAGVTPISAPMIESPVVPATDNTIETMPGNMMPLPDDFSFDAPKTETPVFKEITFGAVPPPTMPIPEIVAQNPCADKLRTHLTSLGYTSRVEDDVVIARRADGGGPVLAIAIHDDADFWIADGDDWFATGKQKRSPVAAAKAAAKKHGAAPILYLAEKNIMNLDALSKSWAADGIRLIHAPTEV